MYIYKEDVSSEIIKFRKKRSSDIFVNWSGFFLLTKFQNNHRNVSCIFLIFLFILLFIHFFFFLLCVVVFFLLLFFFFVLHEMEFMWGIRHGSGDLMVFAFSFGYTDVMNVGMVVNSLRRNKEYSLSIGYFISNGSWN